MREKQFYKDEHFRGDVKLVWKMGKHTTDCILDVDDCDVPYRWWIQTDEPLDDPDAILEELKKDDYIDQGCSEA